MNKIHLKNTISEELDGQRLDQALAKLFPQYSRSQHQTWIRSGHVTVDGKPWQRPRDKVQVNQCIEVQAELQAKERWEAQAIPLDIIYEDDALLIINKPAGLIVHPGAGAPDQTLVNALLHYAPELDTLPRAGIIHRIDKDTSGLLVVARNLKAHNHLTKALQARQISRKYEAIVNGVMISGGRIEAPIGRHPIHRTRMGVIPSGRKAITHYRVIERYRAHTRIRVQLETGRTHQIRVHLTHIHYPIVGDPTYGKRHAIPTKLSERLKQALAQFKRQALHAIQLELTHPETGESMRWKAPLPEDMANLIARLQEDAHEHA